MREGRLYIEAKVADVAVPDDVLAPFDVYQALFTSGEHAPSAVEVVKVQHFNPDKATFHIGVHSACGQLCVSTTRNVPSADFVMNLSIKCYQAL